MRRFVSLIAVAVAIAPPAFAHEGGQHARGTVKEVTATHLVLTTDGHEAAFILTPETRFERGNAPARREDVAVGSRAVVHGKLRGDRLEATEVRLAPAGK